MRAKALRAPLRKRRYYPLHFGGLGYNGRVMRAVPEGESTCARVPELAEEREVWEAKVLRAVCPSSAILAALGFATVTFVMTKRAHVVSQIGFAWLFLASILPGIRPRVRAWLLGLGVPGVCILSIPEFGLGPNLFCGLLLSLVCVRLVSDLRRSLVISSIIGAALVLTAVAFACGFWEVGPAWRISLDPARPANIIRIFALFIGQGIATFLVLGYVLKGIQGLLVERASAVQSLRRETAAKERLRDELAAREKADAKARELEHLGRLASYFGHDTNNALQIVAASLAVLRSGDGKQAQRREALASLESAAAQIRLLSMQLRGFAPGRAKTIGTSALRDGLASSVRMLREVFPDNIDVVLDEAAGATVAIAESELQRILINLAMNASDAMESGGKLTINAKWSDDKGAPLASGAPGAYVAIEINDTGTGIPEAVQARVFEPFFTTKGERGTGLGLASVTESVASCGGSVKLRSQPGAGTTVTIVLPAVPSTAVAASAQEQSGKVTRVLVAEDEIV